MIENATVIFYGTPDAEILIDNKTFGFINENGNYTAEHAPGNYTATARLQGYYDRQVNLVLEQGQTYDFNITQEAVIENGTFNLTTEPYTDIAIYTVPYNKSDLPVVSADTDTNGSMVTQLAPGQYIVFASKPHYVNDSIEVSIQESLITTEMLPLSPKNGSITLVASDPQQSGFSAWLDGNISGTASDNTLIIQNVTPGNHTIRINHLGFKDLWLYPEISAGQHLTMDVDMQPNGTIIAASSMPEYVPGMNISEDSPFNITLTLQENATSRIDWLINGELYARNTTSFHWTPSHLYTSSQRDATIQAVAGNDTMTWTIQVINVLNPYFSGKFGGDAATLHVFHYNSLDITHMNATIISENGPYTVQLSPRVFTNETEWVAQISDIPYGNNLLSIIHTYSNVSNTSHNYTIPKGRAFYRYYPTSANKKTPSSPSSSSTSLPQLDIVYAIFSKDTIAVNESQTIIVDANISRGNITSVTARLQTPEGTRNIALSLINGDHQYGTWSREFNRIVPGEHTLTSVELFSGNHSETVPIEGASFYATKLVEKEEFPELELVYLVVEDSTIAPGQNATLRLDAQDHDGITEVTVHMSSRKGYRYDQKMRLIKGSSNYGSWEARIATNTSDDTLTVESVTLTNRNTSKTIPVRNREVYVQPEPVESGISLISGNIIRGIDLSWDTLRKNPMTPFILATTLTILVVGFFTITRIWS